MVNLASFFCFWTFIFGIHGYQVEFKAGDDGWEPVLINSPDDSSTEQQIVTSENNLPSSTEDISPSTSTEHSATFDQLPSLRPLDFSYYSLIRKAFISMAKHDYQSKRVFDIFNRPSESRAFIDSVFYSLELYRKEEKDRTSALDETAPDYEHNQVADQLKEETEQNTEDNEILGAKPLSLTSETLTNDPLAEIGMHFNSQLEALRRSGVLVEVVKDVGSQIVHLPEDTPLEIFTQDDYSKAANFEHDGFLSGATYETPIEVPEDTAVYPEFPPETKHFTKDWSRTRFPPVKTKIFFNTNINEPATEQTPYASVPKVHKSKSVLTSEQAAYVASQAVEGSLELAETIARETAQLVNSIIIEALRHNAESQITHGHLKDRIPKAKFRIVEKKPYY